MTKLAIAIDLHRCIGCNTCSIACKMQNNVPDGMLWNRVLTEGVEMFDDAVGVYPNLSRTYLPVACQHCENPACMKVCPTGATYKDEQGRVEIDYDRCIGCRMCMGACPYNARVRPRGVAEKCSLCKERTDRGDEPMCVHCCPGDARVFGDLDDSDSAVSRLWRRGGHVLLEEKGTRPQMFYVN